jgi:molybdopterin molybdotransferase
MDGFAVHASDTRSATAASPVELRVVSLSAAGDPVGGHIAAGEAVRIMTGAPLPGGADAVARFEDTADSTASSGGDALRSVAILRQVTPGENVRDAGEELHTGQHVLAPGTLIDPMVIGLLAALGLGQIMAHRRPRIGILSTGSELTIPGRHLPPGRIFDANGPMIRALVSQSGAEAVSLGVTLDRADEIEHRLALAGDVELIIVSGGVSVGDYDLVKDVLRDRGTVAIWQVRLKPGKALAFGNVDGVPLLGLPGNPVAAAISFELFARPLLAQLAGRDDAASPSLIARLASRLPNYGGRRHYARVQLERDSAGALVATPLPDQSSSKLSMLSQADALIEIPETVDVAEAGMAFPVIMLERDPEKLSILLGTGARADRATAAANEVQ